MKKNLDRNVKMRTLSSKFSMGINLVIDYDVNFIKLSGSKIQ